MIFYSNQKFLNRIVAGQQLAQELLRYKNDPNVLVLALPRGGVPVAFEIATALHVPLDVLLVRKLGVPGHEELAMGAVAMDGNIILNAEIIDALSITQKQIDQVTSQETQELLRRNTAYRQNQPFPAIKNKTIIIVDDGLATGATMQVAIRALRKLLPKEIIVAVPVAAIDTLKKLHQQVNEIICLMTPEPFYGVGAWYEDFSQTSDKEVIDLLLQAKSLSDTNTEKESKK